MPYKRVRSGKTRWIGAVMLNGQRIERVFETKTEAKEWEADTRKGTSPTLTTHPQQKTPSTSLHEWASKYLEHALTTLTREVFTEKRGVFKRFFKTVSPALSADALEKRHVLEYLQRQAKERSGNAANRDRKNLVAAWNWGVEYLGLPSLNPCKVHRFPEQRKPRYVPPVEDFWKVFESASKADQVLLSAFLYTAARRGEVFKLTWADVDFKNSRIRLFTKKRSGGNLEADYVEMVQELRDGLRWWWENRPHKDSEFVFTVNGDNTFDNQYAGQPFKYRIHFIRKLCEKAGVKPFGFHAIRHLTASLLDMKGKELTLIQGVLRHKSATTTARYLHSMRGVKAELEDALPKPPGKVLWMERKTASS